MKNGEADSNPRVTIGIPTYNRAHGLLQQALECALGQTYDDLEIVVSDNCSTDDTESVMRGYDDSRIRYVRQRENIGANNNFNYCLNAARGDYFLLFHDDDRIDDDFVATCMAAAGEDRDASTIRTGTRIIDADGDLIYAAPIRSRAGRLPDLLVDWSLGRFSPYLCSTLFNVRQLQAIGGFCSPHNLLQDVIAQFRLNAGAHWIDIEVPKASFRHHDAAMTSSALIERWCEDSVALNETIESLCPDDPDAVRTAKDFVREMAYRRCHGVSSLPKRLAAYRTVNRTLGGERAPLRLLYDQLSRRSRAKLKSVLSARQAA